MSFITFIYIALFSYRAQRIVTTDDWPPSVWFRKQFRKNTPIEDFFTCPWCFGSILTFCIVAFHYFVGIPTVILQMGAAAAVTGYLAEKE